MNGKFSLDAAATADVQDLLLGPKNPEKEFVRSGATFAEVYAMAAHLRVALADLASAGNQDTAVCLAAENKAFIAAALLASVAGGPTLLLPYAFSGKALARMQQITGFTTAIAVEERAFPAGVKVICPAAGYQGDSLKILNKPKDQPSPGALLLKIFTGGSTGAPQIWSKTADNLFQEGLFLARRFRVTGRDAIMATIPPYHIYGLLFSVVLPLVSSATVINETPSFPGDIKRVAEKEQITLLAGVPAHYRVLRDVKIQSPLRLAFSSAGMLDPADNEAFCRVNKKDMAGVVEVYGSTETGGIATRNRSKGEENFTPFPTIDWKIIGDRMLVRSPYISPELPIDNDRYYMTNDRVEARGTKEFSLKGRADTITKVGGKRVDLEEIRQLIKKEAGVSDCAVLALPEAGGREYQIGALIEGRSVNIDTVRKTLSDTLEPYAIPRRFRVVDHIPVKKNGKYDWATIVQLIKK